MRRAVKFIGCVLLFTVITICCAIVVLPHFLDALYYVGPRSAHYDGQRFFNPDGADDVFAKPAKGERSNLITRYMTGTDGRPAWPDHVTVTPSKPAPRIDGQRMVATWIGHATVLVQTQGLNILTDPVWSNRVGPFGIGPGRVAEPGVRLDDLPKIDLIVVSHDHYDHMDLATLKTLWDRDHPLILTSFGNDKVMAQAGVHAVAVDWGMSVRLPIVCGSQPCRAFVTRNHHWGSRWFADRNRALWSSFVVELPGGNIFFAGDTGMGDGQWPYEAARLGPVRFAILPIGAFRFVPGQMSIGSHIGPIDSAEIFSRLGATTAIPVHWGTFRLSYEAYDTPPKLLAAVMAVPRADGLCRRADRQAGRDRSLAPRRPLCRRGRYREMSRHAGGACTALKFTAR